MTEDGEECDGIDDGACLGALCQFDCTCEDPAPPPPPREVPTLPQAALIVLLGGLLAAGSWRARVRVRTVVRRD